MGTQIATATAEYLPIAPESLEIANTYLQTQSISETARMLDIPLDKVAAYLAKPDVKEYITAVYLDSGYRNRFKLGEVLDKVIDEKLVEMQEAGIASNNDIMDLLTVAHKMRMDEINAMIALEKAKNASPKKQTNIQVNDNSGRYTSIFDKLLDIDENAN